MMEDPMQGCEFQEGIYRGLVFVMFILMLHALNIKP